MNTQIQDKLHRLYREVEKARSHWKRLDSDSFELANIMIDRDAEVRSELVELMGAILEDITDPNRPDSFSEFRERVEQIVLGIVTENPQLSEDKIAERLSEHDDFYTLSVDRHEAESRDIVYSMQDMILDHKRDLADTELMRKDPDKYFAAPL